MSQWFCNQLAVDEKTAPVFFGVYVFPSGFSEEEVLLLKEIVRKYPEQNAKDGFGYNIENKRISFIKSINHEDSELAWFIERLSGMVQKANTAMRWNFQLDGFHEKIQYSRYESEAGGFFDGQYDVGKSPAHSSRKLSITIQLSDASEYEGGELELYSVGSAPKRKGSVIIFPSFLMQRIAPLTKGVRESLVVWVSGPPFK